MNRDRQFGWALAAGAAAVAIVALATPASATKYKMSGTWMQRKGQVFMPFQWYGVGLNLSMGNWTEAPMSTGGMLTDPGAVLSDTAGVTQTGAAPKKLKIHKRAIDGFKARNIPLAFGALVQISSMIEYGGPHTDASLSKNGGPGSFTYCGNVGFACVKTAAIPPTTGWTKPRVRMFYVAGANKFGGVMRMGIRYGGWLASPAGGGDVGYAQFGAAGGATFRVLAPGAGMNGMITPGTEMVKLQRGYITHPVVYPIPGSPITQPGPYRTTMGKLTTQTGATGAKKKVHMCCAMGTTMAIMTSTWPYAQTTTNWGWPGSTGTVVAQQGQPGLAHDYFTVPGTDMRNTLGIGTLQLVAGGISQRHFYHPLYGELTAPYGMWDKLFMSIGPTVPTMSPAGFAAAGALVLLAAGYALRRRLS